MRREWFIKSTNDFIDFVENGEFNEILQECIKEEDANILRFSVKPMIYENVSVGTEVSTDGLITKIYNKVFKFGTDITLNLRGAVQKDAMKRALVEACEEINESIRNLGYYSQMITFTNEVVFEIRLKR